MSEARRILASLRPEQQVPTTGCDLSCRRNSGLPRKRSKSTRVVYLSLVCFVPTSPLSESDQRNRPADKDNMNNEAQTTALCIVLSDSNK